MRLHSKRLIINEQINKEKNLLATKIIVRYHDRNLRCAYADVYTYPNALFVNNYSRD